MIPRMPTRNTFIGASVAAVMITNLPLGNAISSAVSPHNDDFPPLRNGYIAISDPAGVCKFNNGKKGSDNWSALNVVVQEGEDTSTAFVACPKTEEHDAFTAKFDEGKLKAYGDQSKRNDTNFEFRHTAPPAKTGLDPLANLDKSTFVHIVKRFREFAGYLKTTYFDVTQLEAVSEGMKDFCPLVEEALKKTFETFQNLCLIFSKTKEAIDVARDEQWMFREQTDVTFIYSPRFNGVECG